MDNSSPPLVRRSPTPDASALSVADFIRGDSRTHSKLSVQCPFPPLSHLSDYGTRDIETNFYSPVIIIPATGILRNFRSLSLTRIRSFLSMFMASRSEGVAESLLQRVIQDLIEDGELQEVTQDEFALTNANQ